MQQLAIHGSNADMRKTGQSELYIYIYIYIRLYSNAPMHSEFGIQTHPGTLSLFQERRLI